MPAKLHPDIQQRIEKWMEDPFDSDTKAEVRRLLSEDISQLQEAFFQDLSFGTGGMRGIMGIGTNRMNIYTVRAATQGLANYLKKQPQKRHSVFIGYDVRHHSREFAEETAKVFAGNGIGVYLSKEICPTPLVSFACRHFHCSAAIMITASHNPPQYNGYKVYWNDGGQIVPPQDHEIIEEVRLVKEVVVGLPTSPLIQSVGREIDAAYFKELKKLQLLPEIAARDLKIVYTNLHGTGIRMIPDALKQWGYGTLELVKEQTALDGNFRNAPSPNPEDTKALRLGMDLLLTEQADLLIATDPDADRMGIAVRHHGKAIPLTGNQIACLCLHHICTSLTKKNTFPSHAGFIKTIVTTELFKTIAKAFGGTCIDVLTGFKYIAEKIRIWETGAENLQYVFGAEESYGYLFGTFVRDKDAISSSCLIAEATASAKANNQTLIDKLHEIYKTYGIHREGLANLVFPDTQQGMETVSTIMKTLRSKLPSHIGNLAVVKVEDYSTGATKLPKSDVLRFWLSDSSKLVIRPSGTESKIKIYAEVVRPAQDPILSSIAAADLHLGELMDAFKKMIS